MQIKNLILTVLLFTISGLLINNCAGTKGDEPPDFYGEDSGQQDDLDDIEALLGITSSEESSETAAQPRTRGEELNLLEGNEVLTQEPEQEVTVAEKNALQDKVEQLEEELRIKERQISNLQAELESKDALIEDLSTQTSTQPARSYSSNATAVTQSEYERTYQEGRNAFESRNYEAAIQYFEALLATSTTHSLSDNAQYWIGESHFALKQYDAAIIDFEKVLTFPKSNKNIDAQFKLGLCYLRKGANAKAAEEFERLNADYPGNRFEQRVNEILSQL